MFDARQLVDVVAILTQRALGAQPIRSFDHARHEVRHRPGQQLFVELPATRTTDMLVTHDANHSTADPNRCVEHGADTERQQVRLRELGGCRIGRRVVGSDATILSQSSKVCRHRLGGDHRAARVAPRGPFEEIHALELRAGGVEAPNTATLDAQQRRHQLGDLGVAGFDVLPGQRLRMRQLGQ